MNHLDRMFSTHPHPVSHAGGQALQCATACAECALVCTCCADACLNEEMVQSLVKCIRLNHDCANACATVASMVSRPGEGNTQALRAAIDACRIICAACRDECRTHADMSMKHCAVCADACDACVTACEGMIAALV